MIRRAFLFALFTLSFAWPCLAQRNICDVNGDCPNHDHQPTFSDPASRIPSGGVMPGPLFQLFHQEPYRNSDMGPLGVVLSTGEFQITVTDLEIPGRGFPFKLTRTYRSRRDGDRSLLGFNWHLNYDEYLTPGSWMDDGIEECEAVEWTMGNGFTELFVNECAAGGHGWKAFLGFFGRIRPHAGGGYEIRYADGTVKTFAQAAQIPGEIDVWLLTKIEDRNGNVMTIHHSGRGIDSITDTLGRTITFAYDDPSADWRITSVTDFSQPTPRRVDYHYDSQGNLDWVKAPEVRDTPNDNNFCEPVSSPACPEPRKTTTYRYLSTDGCIDSVMKHNLKSITDAKGQVFLTNSYIGLQNSPAQCGVPGGGAGLPMDAVVSQVYGGGTLSYGYANLGLGQGTAAGVIATQVTVTDRNDNVQVHKFNPQGNPLSIEYQMGGVRSGENNYVETNTYVDNGGGDQPMLVSRRTQSGGMNVNSSGNLVSYAEGMSEIIEYYDQQSTEPYPDPFQKGNVLRVRRIPRGAPIGEPEIVTQYEYEPLFNQPIKIIDPRGHITMLTYDYQEGTHAQLIASPTPLPVHDDWWPRDEVSLWEFKPWRHQR